MFTKKFKLGKQREGSLNTQKNNILFFTEAQLTYNINFGCTTKRIDIYKHYELITISVVTICHHTKLLTIFSKLHITSQGLIYFITKSLYPLILFALFFPFPPNLSPLMRHQFTFCIYESIFVLFCLFTYFVFQFPHIREITWYLSFSVRGIFLT